VEEGSVKYSHKLSAEEVAAMEMGFLPATDSILSIIANTNYYAVITLPTGDEAYSMLVAWAYLKNGICMPLIYDTEFHTLRNPEVLKNFVRISDEEEMEDDEDGI
jgi:hypothetical protein